MESQINYLNYSSYRVPTIDEFIPGFEYELSVIEYSKINTRLVHNHLCKSISGSFGKVLEVNIQTNTVKIEFYNLYPNKLSIIISDYPISMLNSRDSHYKKWKPEFIKTTQRIIRRGCWNNDAWSYLGEEHLKKRLLNNEIWTDLPKKIKISTYEKSKTRHNRVKKTKYYSKYSTSRV